MLFNRTSIADNLKGIDGIELAETRIAHQPNEAFHVHKAPVRATVNRSFRSFRCKRRGTEPFGGAGGRL